MQTYNGATNTKVFEIFVENTYYEETSSDFPNVWAKVK